MAEGFCQVLERRKVESNMWGVAMSSGSKKSEKPDEDSWVLMFCALCGCHYSARERICSQHGPLGKDGMPEKKAP